MAKFYFLAKDSSGNSTQGSIEAQNESEAKSHLRNKNLTPLRVVKVATQENFFQKISWFKKRISSKDLQIFTRQFSTLINAGIPVVDSLKILGEGRKHPLIKSGAASVKQNIENGKSLSEAMSACPELFDRFYLNMIRAGQEAGILDDILQRLAIYLEKTERLKKQILGALIYPALILAVSVAVVAGILFFVIPQFQEFYKGMGKELPPLTLFVVNLSKSLTAQWFLILIFLFAIPYLAYTWLQTAEGKSFLDRQLLKIPFVGDLLLKSSMAKLTRTLSTLLSSGVGLIEALEISAKTANNLVVEEAILRCKDAVIVGRPLAAPLVREPIIPEMVTQMVSIGEQSGTLDRMLEKIADFYEEDVEVAVRALTSVIEPVLMIFLGGLVAFLMIAMYLPIFNMSAVGNL